MEDEALDEAPDSLEDEVPDSSEYADHLKYFDMNSWTFKDRVCNADWLAQNSGDSDTGKKNEIIILS